MNQNEAIEQKTASADERCGDAVVIGSGRSVWDDLAEIRTRTSAPTFFAVNDMIVLAPTVHHAVSDHGDKLAHWVALRTMHARFGTIINPMITHSSMEAPGVDHVWQFQGIRIAGSSSLLAVRVVLALGYKRIFVAGVPLDGGGYVWSDPRESRLSSDLYDYSQYRLGWAAARAEFEGRVIAVSGWLRELLADTEEARTMVAKANAILEQQRIMKIALGME